MGGLPRGGRPIDVAVQDQQLGTGHATACGLDALPPEFDGIVVVTSGDIPLLDADTLADLIATHRAEHAAVTVLTTTLHDPTGYGRILRTQDREVIAVVEQADATASQRQIREVNAGVYAFDLAALRYALSRLSEDNAQHERYLTDVVSIVRSDGLTVHDKHVDDSMLVAGINDRVQLWNTTAPTPFLVWTSTGLVRPKDVAVSNGVVYVAEFSSQSPLPAAKKFVSALKTDTGQPATLYASSGYDSMNFIIKALKILYGRK